MATFVNILHIYAVRFTIAPTHSFFYTCESGLRAWYNPFAPLSRRKVFTAQTYGTFVQKFLGAVWFFALRQT